MNEQERTPFVPYFLCLFLLVSCLLGISVTTAIHDPFFNGDAAHRMHLAHMPVVRVGNRIWLPVLQVQIWALHLLHLPYYAFKLIPCAYFALALTFLGLLTIRLTRESYAGLPFALLLLFSFAHQSPIDALSIQPYQEPIELACFYGLLWAGALHLRESKWLLLIAAGALLVRESFWIYLFTITLLNRKEIVSRKSLRSSFLFLSAIPVVWMLSIPLAYRTFEGRFPDFPGEWPFAINKAGNRAVAPLLTSFESLLSSLISSGAVYLIAGLAIAWAIGAVTRSAERSPGRRDPFSRRFRSFSVVSLVIIYALILTFDPWQMTFGDERMAVPLLAHAHVWAGLSFADTHVYPSSAKLAARGVLIAALLLSMNWNVATWIPRWYSHENRVVDEIADAVRAASARGKKPTVCIVGESYWHALRCFVAPTLYARRSIQKELTAPERCDLIIARSDSSLTPSAGLVERRDYELGGRSYAVFQRRPEP